METKEKESKPAKKTEKETKYEYNLGLIITKKIENKKENVAEQTEEGQKEFTQYMPPKTETMELLFFIITNSDKNLEYISADVCSNNKKFQKENNVIKKFIIDFTAEEAKKMFEVVNIPDKGDPYIVKDDNKIAFQANVNAELEEEKEIKRIRNYPFLYGNKEYSLLGFYNDIKLSLNYELDIRTYAGRKFDFEGFYNYYSQRPSLPKFNYTSLLQDRGFYIQIDEKKFLEAFGKYIELFMEDKLETLENVYSYKKHLEKIDELFGQMYEDIGKTIIIPCELEDKKFRVIECFFAMQEQDYVKVNNIIYNEKENNLTLRVTFLMSPKEISKGWIIFGDLKVNEALYKAQYKNYPIFDFKHNTDKFKILCHLIKNPSTMVAVEDLIEITRAEKRVNKYEEKIDKEIATNREKTRMKENINIIKKNLNISSDEERTITIKEHNKCKFFSLDKVQKK